VVTARSYRKLGSDPFFLFQASYSAFVSAFGG
jgi:hypothetical protein